MTFLHIVRFYLCNQKVYFMMLTELVYHVLGVYMFDCCQCVHCVCL